MMKSSLIFAATAVVGLIGPLHADDQKAKSQSLDEQLLENLDNELLDGLETTPIEDPADAAELSSEPKSGAPADEDPFARLSKRMHEAERMIPKSAATKTTRKLQHEIVADLEKLIADLEKRAQQQNSSGKSSQQQTTERKPVNQPGQDPIESGQDSNSPARDSTTRLGKNEVRKVDMAQMKSLLKDLWGQLPDKAREQMLQSSPEQFLPKYELLIEQYYKRLAEEQRPQSRVRD
jgi:hypothetical protein